MKNIIIKISVITSLVLYLNASNTIETVNDWNKYPLPQEITSKSRGGLLADKEAMKDGLGAIVIKSINTNTITVDNSAFNKILFENKDKIDTTNGLKELVINNIIIIDNSKLDLINNSGLINPNAGNTIIDGTICDDNNPLTTNDIYTNNVCSGTSIVGTSCDDGNTQTSDDKYDASGVCVGTIIENKITSISFTIKKSTKGGQWDFALFKPIYLTYTYQNNVPNRIGGATSSLNIVKSSVYRNMAGYYGAAGYCNPPYDNVFGYQTNYVDITIGNYEYMCSLQSYTTFNSPLNINGIEFKYNTSAYSGTDGLSRIVPQTTEHILTIVDNGVTKTFTQNEIVNYGDGTTRTINFNF